MAHSHIQTFMPHLFVCLSFTHRWMHHRQLGVQYPAQASFDMQTVETVDKTDLPIIRQPSHPDKTRRAICASTQDAASHYSGCIMGTQPERI